MITSYVTYDENGNLTGAYLQKVSPEHAGVHIIVSDMVRMNWPLYRARPGRLGVDLLTDTEPSAPTVPQSVPMLNARLTMISAGWMAPVQAYLDAMTGIEGEQAREYFLRALTMRRDHPLVLGIPAALERTEAEVDALFIAAGALNV